MASTTLERNSRPRLARMTVITLAVLAFVVLASPRVYRFVLDPSVTTTGQDFLVYQEGARSLLHDRGLYDHGTAKGFLFTYPPFAAVVFLPLTLVPFRVGYALWIFSELAVLVWVVHVAFRPLLERFSRWRPVVLGVVAGAMVNLDPVRDLTLYGQIDLFLVGLVLLDHVARRPFWPRGALIGLATGIKLVPGLFIIHALFVRRRMAVIAAATTVLTFVILPGLSLDYWLHRVRQGDRVGSTTSLANQSLRGVVARIDPARANVLWAVGAVLVATITITLAVRAWRAGHPLASLAIVGLTNALVSPFAWFAHFCWIVVALGVVLGDGRDRRRLLVAAGTWLLLNLNPVYRTAALVEAGRLPHGVGVVLEQSLFLATLVLVGTLAWIARAAAPPDGQVSPSAASRTAAV